MRGKRALLLLTALSLVLTLLAGCGNTAPETGEKAMVIGDTTFNSENWEETVDPHRTYNGWACIRYGIGETLVRYTDSMELEPWLAKSWSNDGDRTWTIVLQDDVTFSSGRKMDAAAVKQCLEHLLENHDRAPGDTKIADMQAEGQTLTIVTSQPNPALMNYLGDPYGCIIDVDASDFEKGIVAGTCGNFPNYIGSPIKSALEKDFGLPVTVANDANCMTLGEVWVGAAQGCTDVIGVTLGTGVGGGILTGGHLLEGARGLGGELGHYRTHALDGVDCTCGAKGCWERYAATTALVRAAQEKSPDWKDGRAIFAAAEAGNETVLALLDAWTDEIAQGLAGMVHIFNPQLILIGGGVSAQQKLLIEPIAAKVKASVMPAFAEGLEVRAAQLHNDAGMVGAVYYFRQTMEKE